MWPGEHICWEHSRDGRSPREGGLWEGLSSASQTTPSRKYLLRRFKREVDRGHLYVTSSRECDLQLATFMSKYSWKSNTDEHGPNHSCHSKESLIRWWFWRLLEHLYLESWNYSNMETARWGALSLDRLSDQSPCTVVSVVSLDVLGVEHVR